jgi:membrane associated rhomboid family serine protease
MIPLRDDIPSRSFPLVNTILILANVAAFMWELSHGERGAQTIIEQYGIIPHFFVHESSPREWATLYTSMFLHAGWAHLISNMLALYIFGDNVEDRMGKVGYLIFYLLAGTAAGLAQVFVDTHSRIPMIGASGAIAGVLGAYIVLYPRARVLTLVPIWIIPYFFEIYAIFYLGIWFLSQLLSGTMSVIVASEQTTGGVAWFAHAGGFVAGLVMVKLFARSRRPRRYAYA